MSSRSAACAHLPQAASPLLEGQACCGWADRKAAGTVWHLLLNGVVSSQERQLTRQRCVWDPSLQLSSEFQLRWSVLLVVELQATVALACGTSEARRLITHKGFVAPCAQEALAHSRSPSHCCFQRASLLTVGVDSFKMWVLGGGLKSLHLLGDVGSRARRSTQKVFILVQSV